MATFAEVLVVLDGEASAERVVGWVRRLCRRGGARVRLLAVRSPAQNVGPFHRPVAFASQIEDAARLESLAYLESVGARLEDCGIPTTAEVRFGEPLAVVLRAVRDSGAGLLAIAEPGRADRGATARLARELVHRASIPVLVARACPQRAA
jgi:nucleotide-binding universal stress UspA family protein